MGGRSLPHAVLMMIPEPWENHEEMTPERRAFYQFHAALMEPWDGPALIAFTDGSVIGAVLDRNGLRPGRYWVTSDGLVVLASEVGVLDIDPATVIRKGRLQPGRIFLADTATGRIVEDEEVKAALAAEHPYEAWLHAGLVHLDDLPDRLRSPAFRSSGAGTHTRCRKPTWSRCSGCTGTPMRNCGSSWPRWRGPGRSRSGRWGRIRRWPCCPTSRG